jgi:hypothetical protein
MKSEGSNKGLELTNLILGICLACAAFMFAGVPATAWNAGMVGSLIAICSAIALYRYGIGSNGATLLWVLGQSSLRYCWDSDRHRPQCGHTS